MSEPKSVLVTAANGDLAEAVCGVFADAMPDTLVHSVDAGDAWPAEAIYCSNARVPRGDHPDYIKALSKRAEEVGAEWVIPCNDTELLRLAQAQRDGECDLPLMMPQPHLVEAFVDKLRGAHWLESHGLPTLPTKPLSQAVAEELPLIAKPRAGSGSSGVILVTTEALLVGLQTQFGDDYVAQGYLSDAEQEYTCAVLRISGEVRTLILRRKLDAGRTIAAIVEDLPEVAEMLCHLAEAADLQGPLNVQLRMGADGPGIFAINPRLSSTVKMRHLLGFQDLIWMVRAAAGDYSIPEVRLESGASVYRLSREIVRPQ